MHVSITVYFYARLPYCLDMQEGSMKSSRMIRFYFIVVRLHCVWIFADGIFTKRILLGAGDSLERSKVATLDAESPSERM
jgi:hypothetical protein